MHESLTDLVQLLRAFITQIVNFQHKTGLIGLLIFQINFGFQSASFKFKRGEVHRFILGMKLKQMPVANQHEPIKIFKAGS